MQQPWVTEVSRNNSHRGINRTVCGEKRGQLQIRASAAYLSLQNIQWVWKFEKGRSCEKSFKSGSGRRVISYTYQVSVTTRTESKMEKDDGGGHRCFTEEN